MLVKETVKNNPRWQNLPEGLTPQERKEDNYQRFMRDMLATVASMDENIGRLLDYLDENNLTENTIVIYAADNGYFMGEHGWIDKKDPYEESIRIPFLVRYPERIKPGTVNGDFVLNIDFAPTLLDYAGVKIPPEMQGRSIRHLLEGKRPDDWRTSIYIQFHVIDKFPYYGIRTERYKLVYFYDQIDDWEFYDLGKDPHELNNVYHDPEYGDVITHLKRELEDLRRNYDIDSVKEQNILNQTEIWERERKNYLDKKMKEWKKT